MAASVTPIVPAQRAPFASTRPNAALFTRWIQAKQLRQLPFGTLLSYERVPAVTVTYAEELLDRLGLSMRRIRFAGTGSQANEAAVMVSRFVRAATGEPERTEVLTFSGSYHGTGACASALSGSPLGQEAAGPLMPGVRHLDADNSWTSSLHRAMESLPPERITAVIVEPVMGSGLMPAPEDVVALAGECRSRGIHFIADEVTTGLGRTGTFTRCEAIGVEPDLLTLAKGMTGGYVPIGAVAVRDDLFEAAGRAEVSFIHGSTTDGHPLAMAAGLAVLNVMRDQKALENVLSCGDTLRGALDRVRQKWVPDGDVQGPGLMIRLGLRTPAGEPWSATATTRLRRLAEEEGLLCSEGANCLLFLPPLTITSSDCEEIGDLLNRAFERAEASRGHGL